MKATTNGNLNIIPDCNVVIPGAGTIPLNNLPDLSDGKQAVYNGETIIGRSTPLYTYSHSGDRQINMQLHFFITRKGDGQKNLNYLRMIQSALYPREGGSSGAPYIPPPICTITCGKLLATEPLCVALQSYNVKFPTEVVWEEETLCPYRFDVDTSWIVVYTSSDLPFQSRIVKSGR